MDLKEGMYVRFECYICKIEEIEDETIFFDTEFCDHWAELTSSMDYQRFVNDYKPKASFNIIDLIEDGDYVNGYKVDFVQNNEIIFNHNHPTNLKIFAKDIKSIVTRQAFNNMNYHIQYVSNSEF